MLKKIFLSITALIAFFAVTLSANAADVCKVINVDNYGYPNIDFYPRYIHVNSGDVVHLTINNGRRYNTRLMIPTLNINQQIYKLKDKKIDLCFSNPASNRVWFQISALEGEKISGYFIIDNFCTPNAAVKSKPINTAVLNNIINYNTAYSYPEKSEPAYYTRSAASPVRGYW